jgi:hypothetical protein
MFTAGAPIGIDLDNTIVDYSDLFVALSRDFAHAGDAAAAGGKGAVRTAMRRLPDGEGKWQQLQALVYGARMAEARLIDGVLPFMAECRRRDIELRIVSHKTRYAAADPDGVDLRDASRSWLAASGILEVGGLDLDHVFFEDTRSDKIRRIRSLGCSFFVDDLDEVFAEQGFPESTIGLLFDPERNYPDGHRGLAVCRSWQEISKNVFCGGR